MVITSSLPISADTFVVSLDVHIYLEVIAVQGPHFCQLSSRQLKLPAVVGELLVTSS